MGNFSDELTAIMKNRKIAVEDIILSMNISRAAFFKYKNGSRTPASVDIVQRFADALCLNQSDRENLLRAYKIDSIGEYKYLGLKAVEDFLTTPIGDLVFDGREIPAVDQSRIANVSVVHGKMQVIMHIHAAIQEGLNHGDVTIFGTISEDDIFSIIQHVVRNDSGNRIEHIMAMNGSDDIQIQDRLYSIRSLGRLITTMCRCENYYPFYYYASLSTLRTLDDLLNNMVVTEQCVFCYSGEMDHGILYRDERICSLYRDIVGKWRKKAKPFAEKMDLALSLKAYERFGNSKDVRYIFLPGICLTSVYEPSDNLLETNLRSDENEMSEFFREIPDYIVNFRKRLDDKKGLHHYVVTGNALRYNLRSGNVQELPRKITNPLTREQMQTMMRRFYRVCDKYDFRVLEDERFPEDNCIEIEASPTEAVINVSLPDETFMRIFLVRELSAAALIYDYLKILYNEGLKGRDRSEWFEELLGE